MPQTIPSACQSPDIHRRPSRSSRPSIGNPAPAVIAGLHCRRTPFTSHPSPAVPFVFEKKRLCRWKFQEAKIIFRSFLKKNAFVGENSLLICFWGVKKSPIASKKAKNERKLKCEERKNHRQSLKNAKTNGKSNVKSEKIADRLEKSQKRTETQM